MENYYLDRPNYLLKLIPSLMGLMMGIFVIYKKIQQSSGGENITVPLVVTVSVLVILCFVFFIASFPSLPEIIFSTLFDSEGIKVQNRHGLLTYFIYTPVVISWQQIQSLDISNRIYSKEVGGRRSVFHSDIVFTIMFKDNIIFSKKLQSVNTSAELVKFLQAIEPFLAEYQIQLTIKNPGPALQQFLQVANSWQALPNSPRITTNFE